MSIIFPTDRVLATGTFLYAGTVECDLRVVFSSVRYGTGDDEDPPDISEDVVVDTYYIQYGSTTQRGLFNAGGGCYSTLAEARSAAEAMPGIGTTVKWDTSAV